MKTLVIGASPNPSRYSYKAVRLLKKYKHEVIPLGIRKGLIEDEAIILGRPHLNDIHTVTLYVGPERQKDYYDYIFSLDPKRIIFNPGTENNELVDFAEEKNIETVMNCTLVMLNSDLF